MVSSIPCGAMFRMSLSASLRLEGFYLPERCFSPSLTVAEIRSEGGLRDDRIPLAQLDTPLQFSLQ